MELRKPRTDLSPTPVLGAVGDRDPDLPVQVATAALSLVPAPWRCDLHTVPQRALGRRRGAP